MSNHKQQLVVRPHRPGYRRLEIVLWISLAVFLFAAGFMLGFKFFDAAMVEKRQQKLELSDLRNRADDLEQKLANAELTARIDRVALEQVRQGVTSLQAELAVDKEELSLYRNLLQGGGSESGLLIGELTLKPMLELQGIAYRLVVQQKENKLKRIKVNIKVVITGLSDGKTIAMGLELLDNQLQTTPVQAEFKYFHILEGVLTLPFEFRPQSITVEIWKKGVNTSRVEREFDWRIDES